MFGVWAFQINCAFDVGFFWGVQPVVAGYAESLLSVDSFRNQDLGAFPELAERLEAGWAVPGLKANFVPQGLAWSPDGEGILISGYVAERFNKPRFFRKRRLKALEKRSAILLVDHPSGEPLVAALLENADGSPMRRHAGGIAVHGGHIWIPGQLSLHRFPLNGLLDQAPGTARLRAMGPAIPVDFRGSFLSVFEDSLLIGDFILPGKRNLPHRHSAVSSQHTGWTAIYHLDPATGLPRAKARYRVNGKQVLRPDGVIHHRRRVQGIAIREDGCLALSLSYGNTPSQIAFYRPFGAAVLSGSSAPIMTELPDGSKVPAWLLSRENWLFTVEGPPGSEGLLWNGQSLAIVFEGGAMPYRKRWDVLEDRALVLRFE